MTSKPFGTLSKPLKKEDETLTKINKLIVSLHKGQDESGKAPRHQASSFGYACLRKIYYSYFRTPKDSPPDAKGGKILQTGIFIEEMVMSWLKGIGEHVPYVCREGEEPKLVNGVVDPQFPISLEDLEIKRGYIDNVSIVNDSLWIHEIKSMNTFKFKNLEEPLPEHLVQVAIYYIAMLNHLKNGDFNHIFQKDYPVAGVKVIYLDKNSSELKVFKLEPDELLEKATEVFEKYDRVKGFTVGKKLPPKTEDKCSYCDYRRKCSKEENVA